MFFSSTSTGDLQKLGVKNKANGQRPPTQLPSFVILLFWVAEAFLSQQFLLKQRSACYRGLKVVL